MTVPTEALLTKVADLSSTGALSWHHPMKERLRLNVVMFLVAAMYSGRFRGGGRPKLARA